MKQLTVEEFTDDSGIRYCYVTDGDHEAEYANIEEATWAIVSDHVKTGVRFQVNIVTNDAGDLGRFNRARAEAYGHYSRLDRQSRAPRSKADGRPLFVAR